MNPSPFAMQSPLDLSPLPSLDPTPLADMGRMTEQARKAQKAWGELPVEERIRAISKVRDRVLDRATTIGDCVGRELGKPDVEVYLSEVLPSADVVSYWT